MRISETLETPRLFLRKWDLERDLEPLTAIIHDPSVMKFAPEIGNEASAKAFMEAANLAIDKDGYGSFACEVKHAFELVGYVGLSVPEFGTNFTPGAALSWKFTQATWGKGYALEAAKACIKMGFDQYNLPEIVAFVPEKDRNTRRVIKSLGMNYNPSENFNHPKLPPTHAFSLQILYRRAKPK